MHRYWKHRIDEHLKNCGYKVEIEVPVGDGKTIDIVAERNGKRIAFEIERRALTTRLVTWIGAASIRAFLPC